MLTTVYDSPVPDTDGVGPWIAVPQSNLTSIQSSWVRYEISLDGENVCHAGSYAKNVWTDFTTGVLGGVDLISIPVGYVRAKWQGSYAGNPGRLTVATFGAV